jgi:hypothetical protein
MSLALVEAFYSRFSHRKLLEAGDIILCARRMSIRMGRCVWTSLPSRGRRATTYAQS